jgi:putative ABC transport system ATP-binding protein
VIAATRRLIDANRLTALMVTHSMQQAADLGDRLVVMHRGGVERVYEGAAKSRLRPDQLTELFAELRMQDRIDTATAGMLAEAYIEAR